MAAIQLKEILSSNDIKALPASIIPSIEHAINESFDKKIEIIEKSNAKKFDSLVESLSEKFDTKVNNVIIESVKDNASEMVTKKFYGIVKDMVNLLEDAGIPTTDATKQLQVQLKDAGSKLQQAYNEVQAVKDMYNDQLKLVMIMKETKGMRPEVVDAAIEFFKNKDIREIDKDAIANFLDGDHSDLFSDNAEADKFNGEIDLDQVKDALDDLNSEINGSNVSPYSESKPKFESLGKGLKQQKALFTPDVSKEMLTESVSDELLETDTRETLTMINNYRGLGFNSFG